MQREQHLFWGDREDGKRTERHMGCEVWQDISVQLNTFQAKQWTKQAWYDDKGIYKDIYNHIEINYSTWDYRKQPTAK